MLWQATSAALAAESSHPQGRAQGMRNSVEIPWGWDFSWGKALLRKGCKVEKQRREEQVQNQHLIPRAFWKAEETSERKTIQAERQKKWEHHWSREEWRRVREAGKGYLGSSFAACASLPVCHTEFVLQQFQGCDQIEKRYEIITRTPNQAVKEWGKAVELKMMLKGWSAVETEITEPSAHSNSQSWEWRQEKGFWKRGGEWKSFMRHINIQLSDRPERN